VASNSPQCAIITLFEAFPPFDELIVVPVACSMILGDGVLSSAGIRYNVDAPMYICDGVNMPAPRMSTF